MNGLNWWDQILLRPYGIIRISIVGATTISADLIATAITTTNIDLTANANVELDGAATPLILTIANLGANGDLAVDLSASAEQINAKENAANAEINLGADPLEIQTIRPSSSFGTAEIVLSDVADITAIVQSANPINIVGNTDFELDGAVTPLILTIANLGANGDLAVDLSASAEQTNAKENAANAEINLGADPLEIQIIRASPSSGTAEIVLSDAARAQAISRTIDIYSTTELAADITAIVQSANPINIVGNTDFELDGAVTPLILTIANLGANGDLAVDLSASPEQTNAKESAANAEINLGADPLEIQIIRASPSSGTAEIVLSDAARAQAISRTIDIYSTTELAVDITAIAQSANPINIVGNTDFEIGGVFSPSAQSVSFFPSSESVMEISGTGSLSAFGKKDLSSSTTLSLTSTAPVAKQRQGLMSDISAKKMADVASETLLDVSYILSE